MLPHTRTSVANTRRGTLLVGVLIALSLFMLVVGAVVLSGARDNMQSIDRFASVRADYNAEAVANMAIREVILNTDIDGDALIGGVEGDFSPFFLNAGQMSSSATINGNVSTIHAWGSATGTIGPQSVIHRTTLNVRRATDLRPGLLAEVWKINGWVTIAATDYSQPRLALGWTPDPYLPNSGNTERVYLSQPTDGYSIRYSGKIFIPTTGSWTFGTTSDDGSTVWINGTQVVANDFGQGPTFRNGSAITLDQGWHDIQIFFWDGGGGHALTCHWTGPGFPSWTKIPPENFGFLPATRPYPIVAHASATHSGEASAPTQTVDAWNSADGPFTPGLAIANADLVATNGTAANSIQVSGDTDIKGNAASGVGSTPASAINVNSGGEILGTRSALSTARFVPVPYVPPAMPASAGALTLWNTNQTISSNQTYSQIVLSGTSVLTISGNITIHVTGDLGVYNQSQIVITPGSTLRLFVQSNSMITDTAVINPSGLPNRCWLIFRGNFTAYNSAKVAAHIYTPFGTFDHYTNTEISGTFHGLNFQGFNRGLFHGDVGPSGQGGATAITSWFEP